jgi:hypothetical protein
MTRINFFLIRGICAIRCFEMFMELAMEYFDGVFRHPVFSGHSENRNIPIYRNYLLITVYGACDITIFRD